MRLRKKNTGEPTVNGGHFAAQSHDEADITLHRGIPTDAPPVYRAAQALDDAHAEFGYVVKDAKADFLMLTEDLRMDVSDLLKYIRDALFGRNRR